MSIFLSKPNNSIVPSHLLEDFSSLCLMPFFRSSLQKNSSNDPSRLTFTSFLSLLKSLKSGFRSHYSAGRALARSPVTPHCKCDSTSTVSPQFSSQLSAHFTPSLLKHFLPLVSRPSLSVVLFLPLRAFTLCVLRLLARSENPFVPELTSWDVSLLYLISLPG